MVVAAGVVVGLGAVVPIIIILHLVFTISCLSLNY